MPRTLFSRYLRFRHLGRRGFTLIEALIAVVVLGLALVSIFALVTQLSRLGTLAQRKAVAASIAQEQIEVVRNLPYASIGSEVTFPVGILESTKTVVRDGVSFTVKFDIDFIDDPADYTVCIGNPPSNSPCDTVPADYKRIETQVCWDGTSCLAPVRLTTYAAPPGLENSSGTGALLIKVLDANGQPVNGATITVSSPALPSNVVNMTDSSGTLALLSLPPSNGDYHVVATKPGYVSDSTYPASIGNPTNPDTTVSDGSGTSVTLSMDKASTLVLKSLDQATCTGIGATQVRLHGQRLISQTPDVYLYDQNLTLDGTGSLTVPNLPWDQYTLTVLSSGHDIAGINPPDRIILAPNTTVTATVALSVHQTENVRFIVRDIGSKVPLAGASIQVSDGVGYDTTLVTEQGNIRQSNWAGGPGQATVGSADMYLSKSGGTAIPGPNSVTLETTTAAESVSEDFTTATHEDAGNTTAIWSTTTNTVVLPPDAIVPGQYAASAQAQSTTMNAQNGKITDVTLTATSQLNGQTITYEVSADGTIFEPVVPGTLHSFAATGSDLRWRATLTTSDAAVSPILSGVSLAYHQLLIPDSAGTLTSSTFDSGTATNYLTMSWQGATPSGVGTDAIRFQVATNDDDATWNFTGPDGTGTTYFSVSGGSLPAALSGHRYLRYKLFLHTDSALEVPALSSMTIIKNNACTPPGQAFFSPLPAATTYTVTTTMSGYSSDTQMIPLAGNQSVYIDLTPS